MVKQRLWILGCHPHPAPMGSVSEHHRRRFISAHWHTNCRCIACRSGPSWPTSLPFGRRTRMDTETMGCPHTSRPGARGVGFGHQWSGPDWTGLSVIIEPSPVARTCGASSAAGPPEQRLVHAAQLGDQCGQLKRQHAPSEKAVTL